MTTVVFRASGVPSHHRYPVWRVERVAAVAGDPVPSWMPAGPDRVVPAGTVAVVGDHWHSQDSRQLGFVPVSLIAGRVVRSGPARLRPVA